MIWTTQHYTTRRRRWRRRCAAAAVAAIGTAAFAWREPLINRALLLFHAYEGAALAMPIVTKALTSGVAYLLGDVLAQRLTADGRVSKGRVVRSGIAGFASHGPQLHFWSLLLDRFVDFGSGVWALRGAVVAKIALDQAVFALYINAAYCMTLELLKRTPPKLAMQRIRRAAWPSLKRSWQFWPAVHVVTFGIVPHHLRVLWVDVVEVVWVAVLATCVNRASSDVIEAAPDECDLDAQIPICADDLGVEAYEAPEPAATTA